MWWKKKKDIPTLKRKLKQKKIRELVDMMLEANIEVHSAPMSKEYFIIDKPNQVHILIDESSIKICNHEYLYEISISAEESQVYIKKVKQKIQEESEAIKKGLFKNELGLIDKITTLYTK